MKNKKPTYRELESRVSELEATLSECKGKKDHYSINEEIFSRFFNSIKDFIFILDETASILYVNDYVVDKLGYTRNELFGESVLQLHPPERREEASRIVTEMLSGKSTFCPIPIMMKNGDYVPVETRVAKGIWNDKNVIFGVSKDISELKLSEEKFSKAFMDNANPMAISVYKTGQYIEVNQKFLDTLHLKREDVIGKTSLGMKLIDETTREKLSHILDSDKGISNIEMKIVIGDSNYYGLFSADTIFIQDKKCLLTVMQDITEIKRIQQELSDSETRLKLALEDLIRLNDQLKEINSSKDKLLEIMAHDLRNPLITIMNSAELLTDNILNNEPENSGFLLQDIFAQAKNTLSLLDNLLTWAKSQTGKLIYNPRNLQLLPIVKQVFSLFHLAALKKNISLIFDESDDLEIFADLNMIETILRNLISNAVKFTHSGGMVTIHAGMLQNNIEITVSDNGIGMKEEIANKLFRTDTNYSSPGTDNERGSGLGLILCHDFVKKHKGNIWIESEPGKGSRFIFTLPLKKET